MGTFNAIKGFALGYSQRQYLPPVGWLTAFPITITELRKFAHSFALRAKTNSFAHYKYNTSLELSHFKGDFSGESGHISTNVSRVASVSCPHVCRSACDFQGSEFCIQFIRFEGLCDFAWMPICCLAHSISLVFVLTIMANPILKAFSIIVSAIFCILRCKLFLFNLYDIFCVGS